MAAPRKTSAVKALVAHTQRLLPLRPMQPPALQRWTAAGLLADWLLTRVSPKTRQVYAEDVKCLAMFLECTPEQAAHSLLQGRAAAEQVLEHWLVWMRDVRGLAPYSRARRIWAAQSFCKHAARREAITYEVSVKVPKLITRKDTSGPDHKKLDGLLVDLACEETDRAAIRDGALLGLMYGLGLRRGEVLTMRVRDCDPDTQRLAIVSKGHLALVPKRDILGRLCDPSAKEPERELLKGIPAGVWLLLGSWMRVLHNEFADLKPNQPLWWAMRKGGKPYARMAPNGLAAVMKRRLKGHRMRQCTTHGLRHTAITKLLDVTNGNLRLVQGFARHADLRQLHRYDDRRRGLFAEGAALVADSLG